MADAWGGTYGGQMENAAKNRGYNPGEQGRVRALAPVPAS